MKPICWHVILRLGGRRLLVRNVRERRILASTVAACASEFGIFLYHAPDTHLHLGSECRRPAAGRLAQVLAVRLNAALQLEARFDVASILPVDTQKHLSNLLAYVLGNSRHHGVTAQVDPLLEASNLLDLLGLRIVESVTAPRLKSLLPRLRRRDLVAHYGLDEIHPGTDLRHLAEAAASAVALPDLTTRTPRAVDAKAALVAVGLRLGATKAHIARILGTSSRNVNLLAHRPVEPRLLRAVPLQIGLRERLGVIPQSTATPQDRVAR